MIKLGKKIPYPDIRYAVYVLVPWERVADPAADARFRVIWSDNWYIIEHETRNRLRRKRK